MYSFFQPASSYDLDDEYAPSMRKFYHDYAVKYLKQATSLEMSRSSSFQELAEQLGHLSKAGDTEAESLLSDIHQEGLIENRRCFLR